MMFIFLFVLGAVVGSFLNVCIYRMPRKQSIVKPRSRCPSCGTSIAWYDNIPLLSFLLLRGKCRVCKSAISLRYPIVELISGILCVLFYIRFGLTAKAFILWFLSSAMVVASFIDTEFHEIPDAITLPGIAAGLCVATIYPPLLGEANSVSALLHSFLGVIAGGGSIYVLGFIGEFIFKREAMGGGDVKFLAMVGSFVGWKLVLFTFFLAPFFGSVIGIVLKIREGRDIIPYGPYLSLAALVAVFYGEEILRRLFFF